MKEKKAIVGTFSVVVETDGSFAALILNLLLQKSAAAGKVMELCKYLKLSRVTGTKHQASHSNRDSEVRRTVGSLRGCHFPSNKLISVVCCLCGVNSSDPLYFKFFSNFLSLFVSCIFFK